MSGEMKLWQRCEATKPLPMNGGMKIKRPLQRNGEMKRLSSLKPFLMSEATKLLLMNDARTFSRTTDATRPSSMNGVRMFSPRNGGRRS
jgi:hypothetical protein